jgi:hypothetical protein
MWKGRDYIETVTMAADLNRFKTSNTACWSFQFLKAMCHVGLVSERVCDEVNIIALRGWSIQEVAGLTFTEKSVELSDITYYENLHPELKVTANRPLESQAYGVGTKERGLDKYMRFFHDLNLKTVKVWIPDIYSRNGMRFWAGGIQFKDNAFELIRRYSRDHRRYAFVEMWKMNDMLCLVVLLMRICRGTRDGLP